MKFVNFAIVKFSLFLTLGILSAKYFPLPINLFLYLSLASLLALSFAWYKARKQLFPSPYFGIITFICFISIGHLSFQLRIPELQQKHYNHLLINTDSFSNKPNYLQLKINEVLKPDSFNNKYIASVISLNEVKSKGLILVNVRKDCLSSFITNDDVLLVSSIVEEIKSPLNPYQFDYSKYMKTLGVYYQIRNSKNEVLQKERGIPTLRGKAEKVRNYILEKLKKSSLTPAELSIIQALVLGQKKDISKQMYREYAAAGAIHILAVSGLHVGIVYFIFLFIFSPLKRLPKGAILLSLLIVISLWCYAFITGLSPSVIRAVTMFSFFAFAKVIHRQTNSINTLFLSYFTLLLLNPMWLFQVGFQLSYLAVFFILWILPTFNKLYYPKNRIIKKLWGIITVTIAAQLGIIPLSLYYFHQFPGLFFITNIVVLPFLSILLGGGILIIVLAVFNVLPVWLTLIYNTLIQMLNNFISWVANQETFVFQDIHFSIEKVMASYAIIITIILLWKKRSVLKLGFLLLSFVLLISVFIWDDFKNSENQLILFHKTRHTLIGYQHANGMKLFRSDSTFNYQNKYPVKSFRVAKDIDFYTEEELPKIFKYKHKTILILDNLGVYPKTSDIDIVLLSFSPKVNLERMIDSLQPKLIIADGNNYTSYVSRWKKTCLKKNIPFYNTKEKGAYDFNSE